MKLFFRNIFIFLVPICAFLLLYNRCYVPHLHGDMGAIGGFMFDDEYDSVLYDIQLPNSNIETTSDVIQHGDSCIITMGDSFSQMGDEGYQVFLSQYYKNYRMINYAGSYSLSQKEGDFVRLCYSGKLDSTIVILETVERHLVESLCALKFYKLREQTHQVRNSFESDVNKTQVETSSFDIFLKKINDCYEYYSKRLFRVSDFMKKRTGLKDDYNPIKKTMLNIPAFSCKGDEYSLYFYDKDLKTHKNKDIQLARSKMDSLLCLAREHNVKLIYLIAADKYDVYQSFIKNNKYPNISTLEKLLCGSDFRVLNSKSLLLKRVVRGEKDIYKCWDSHWSPKGSSYIADEISKRIDKY